MDANTACANLTASLTAIVIELTMDFGNEHDRNPVPLSRT
jgi:hypothetical protein